MAFIVNLEPKRPVILHLADITLSLLTPLSGQTAVCLHGGSVFVAIPMIRPATPDDTAALLAIAAAISFEPAELTLLHHLLIDSFSDRSASFCLTDDDEHYGLVGVAYCEPERMTDQTWNLQLIAMHPGHQGQGRGSQLLRPVEATLKAGGGRLLLVETLASFDQAQAFYLKNGFEEEARIRDFYAPGDDKIVFCKGLR